MINDLPTRSVIPGKKINCSVYPIFSSHLFFFRKVEANSSGGARVFAARGKRLCCCPL